MMTYCSLNSNVGQVSNLSETGYKPVVSFNNSVAAFCQGLTTIEIRPLSRYHRPFFQTDEGATWVFVRRRLCSCGRC